MAAEPKQTEDTPSPGAPEVPKKLAQELGLEALKGKAESPAKSSSKTSEDTPAAEATLIENTETDKAVDEVLRAEADELLKVQDKTASKTIPNPPHHSLHRFRWVWRLLLLIILAGVIVVVAVPAARYKALNTLGVQSSSTVEVLDNTTGQPLKNVTVTIGSVSAKTDSSGHATIAKLPLGAHTLTIERIAFAGVKRHITIGWGSNPLGTYKLRAVGVQYIAHIQDYLSGKPLQDVEVSSGEATALSDAEGKAILTVPDTDVTELPVVVSSGGYRTEELTLHADPQEPQNVTLVASAKTVFITREAGIYNVYRMDIDGKNKKLLLAGTGTENSNIALAMNATGDRAALVSTRDNVRTGDGFLLSTLTLIDVINGNTITLDHGDQMQLIDWIGDTLVYQMVTANASADSGERQRIISYNYLKDSRAQLAAANAFASVTSAGGALYYATKPIDPAAATYVKTNLDGSKKQTLLSKEVWSGYRTTYESMTIQASDGWYLVDTTGSVTDTSAPSALSPRTYVDNPAGKLSAWVSGNTLTIYDVTTDKDTPLRTQRGLTYPVRWLTDTVLTFRVASGQEVAEYVVSTEGGEARKVTDVSNAFGITQSY